MGRVTREPAGGSLGCRRTNANQVGGLVFAPTIEDPALYWAGSDGSVYSFYLGVARRLRISPGVEGYFKVWLAGKKRWLHSVVCAAFHGPCPRGMECSHLDGCSTNNRPENLIWESRADNCRRKTEIHRAAGKVLRPRDVRLIRNEYRGEFGQKAALAKRFGVSQTSISHVLSGHTWSWLTP